MPRRLGAGHMPLFEFTRKQSLPDEQFPAAEMNLKVLLDLEFHTSVPPSAARTMALRLLREALENAVPDDLTASAVVPHASPALAGEAQHGDWVQPANLDLRVIKSAHRMVLEVAQRGPSGKAVLASDLVDGGSLSAPTVGRLLKEGEPVHDYVRQFVLISASGRTKALDLTPAGRLLASRIRAGTVPA